MAKNRTKQREHLNCGMTKEERLRKEATEREAQCREEALDLVDYCGIKDPTPYLAVKNIIRKERAAARKADKPLIVPTAATAATA